MDKKIVIQKFGGTSVSTIQKREAVAARVKEALEKSLKPVVVVSAIGRKGDPYATDTLLSLVGSAIPGSRETDLLLSCGEIISSVVLYEVFVRLGISARVLTGGQAGILTDNCFGNAGIKFVNTTRLLDLLEHGIVPIVTGFQGMNEEMDVTTLGRGASDVTAAILGEALGASLVEIYTDVDGIMTADPRIVKDARVIAKISYAEIFQFADQGAKVIHPKAVEYAMRGNIPLLIRNTMTDAPGTLITSTADCGNISGRISGIAHLQGRTQVSLFFDDTADTFDNNRVFELLATSNVSIDLINIFPCYKVFTIDNRDSDTVRKLLEEHNFKFNIIQDCCKITVFSNRIKGLPGVMASILKELNSRNIKVLQTADSHTTICCLVRDQDTFDAVNALHALFTAEN